MVSIGNAVLLILLTSKANATKIRPTSLLTDEELEAKKWQDEYIQKHYGVSPITYEADDGRK